LLKKTGKCSLHAGIDHLDSHLLLCLQAISGQVILITSPGKSAQGPFELELRKPTQEQRESAMHWKCL